MQFGVVGKRSAISNGDWFISIFLFLTCVNVQWCSKGRNRNCCSVNDGLLKFVFTAFICRIFSLNSFSATLSEFFLEKIDAHTFDSLLLLHRTSGMSPKYQRILQSDQIWTLITKRRNFYPGPHASYKKCELRNWWEPLGVIRVQAQIESNMTLFK